MKPRALDLFCGAGGASMGLHRAGFEVMGVDWVDQPRYPFQFRIANALDYPLEGFDFIWASPPCQAFTVSAASYRKAGKFYPDLLTPIRQRLQISGAVWVIENTPNAPMRADLILCGSYFGLPIARHRLFELSWAYFELFPSCAHAKDLVCVVGHGAPSWSRSKKLRGEKYWRWHSIVKQKEAMGIDWMTRKELTQAVPPAYAEFIGTQAMKFLQRQL